MSKRLLSIPFISLYVAASSAVVLNAERDSWSSKPWFPIAVGLTAVAAIVPLRYLAKKKLHQPIGGRVWRIILFFIMGIVPLAGLPFLTRQDLLLIVGVLLMCAFFLYAAVGTILQWPGFRLSSTTMVCEGCNALLAGEADICPECGTAVEV